MTRPIPAARANRVQALQQRASALARVLGSSSGVRAATGDEGPELWLYGVVGGYWFGFSDTDVARTLAGLNVDRITVRLNSPGGDVVQGIAIGNLFRNHKARVDVVVDGLAASSASLIALGGDRVVMSPGSQMMLHDPWMFTIGNERELRQDADFLAKQAENMAGVYAMAAGGDRADWRAVMTAEPDGTWYDADEAVAAGLADEVGTVVAVGAAPTPPPVDLDDEDDEMAARAAWDLEVLIAPAARAAWNVRPAAGPKPPSPPGPGSATTQEGETAVAFSDEQLTDMRQQLGLAADADEETIVSALREALAEQAEDTGSPAGPAATTPALPDGVVAIDAEVLAGLQAGAQTAAALAEQRRLEDRKTAIDAALRAGKITANTRANYEALWDKDAEGTRALLDALPAGVVPTAEVGHDQQSAERSGALGSETALTGLAAGFGLTPEVYV